MDYNTSLCRICQTPDNSDLSKTSTTTCEGATYLDLLKFIFHDIIWVEDHFISVACQTCLRRIKEVAEFKTLCIESNRLRGGLNQDPGIKLEIEIVKNEEPTADVDCVSSRIDLKCGTAMEDPIDSSSKEFSAPKRRRKAKKVIIEDGSSSAEELDCKRTNTKPNKRKRTTRLAAKRQKIKRKIVSSTSSDDNANDNEDRNTIKTTDRHISKKKSCNDGDDEDDDCLEEMDFKENDTKALSLYIPQYAPTPLEDTCRRCKLKFSTYEKLREHVNTTHLKLRRYHCDTCQEGFISKDLLERHNYKHDGVRKHVCTICGSKYITQGDLRHHLDRHVEEAKFACDICPDKKYKTLNSLRSHKQLVHIDPKDFKYLCPECGKKFPQSSGLTVHMLRIHANVRSFICQLCEKTFCTKGEMVTHQKTHTNVRDFKCELCGAEYKHKDQMLLHQTKVHGIGNHKIRPNEKYECRYCSKVISSKDKLKRHIRTHTGVKPFKCRLCEMNFTCKSYVRCHVKRKHNIDVDANDFNIKSYCEICEDFLDEEEVGGNLLPVVEEQK